MKVFDPRASHVLDVRAGRYMHVICEVQSKGTSRHVSECKLKKSFELKSVSSIR